MIPLLLEFLPLLELLPELLEEFLLPELLLLVLLTQGLEQSSLEW
jgi:hypothetical protein